MDTDQGRELSAAFYKLSSDLGGFGMILQRVYREALDPLRSSKVVDLNAHRVFPKDHTIRVQVAGVNVEVRILLTSFLRRRGQQALVASRAEIRSRHRAVGRRGNAALPTPGTAKHSHREVTESLGQTVSRQKRCNRKAARRFDSAGYLSTGALETYDPF